jgi:hypothetical protein
MMRRVGIIIMTATGQQGIMHVAMDTHGAQPPTAHAGVAGGRLRQMDNDLIIAVQNIAANTAISAGTAEILDRIEVTLRSMARAQVVLAYAAVCDGMELGERVHYGNMMLAELNRLEQLP